MKSLCLSIGAYDMTKWNFDMINREEYKRVCDENKRLKEELATYKKGEVCDRDKVDNVKQD